MRDRDVRDALHRALRAEHRSAFGTTLVVDELGLCGAVRVDVAVINGSLSGYELKSERDSIRRLPVQADYYSRVFDFATLVTAEKHLAAARKLVPRWWGVVVASTDGGRTVLESMRTGTMNPKIDAYSLAQLLWRDEVLEELEARSLSRGFRSRPRTELWRRLADEVSLDVLRGVVRERLRARTGWRPAP